ncbi:MAG: hypothetical protein EXR79_14490 [Myxococcales bacterium]|nr:hypothetical protein [Myxococcales bacterium]
MTRFARPALLLPSLLPSLLFALPATAAPKKGGPHPILLAAAPRVQSDLRDLTLLATAVPDAKENRNGSAALVRNDQGKDGGLPACWLLGLEGRPATPGRVETVIKLPVCPAGSPKGTELGRTLLGKRAAWRVRLESARADTFAKGVESRVLWALAADPGEGAGLKVVYERTSTTFKSRTDPGTNQLEQCEAPAVVNGSEPGSDDDWPGLATTCETETMLGSMPKRERLTFRYQWMGDRYLPQ